MKILFISTSIPPYPDMQSIRNIFLINGLERRGHSIDIVTAKFPWASDSLINNLSSKTNVYYTKPAFLVRLSKYLEQNRNLAIFNKIFNVLVHYIAIPDKHMFWNFQAQKEIRNLLENNNEYSLIITSSGSYTAHFVGYWTNKKFGIDWVAEYGDPWGLDSYGEIKSLNYRIEMKIMKLCKGLVFTTQPTIKAYSKFLSNNMMYHLAPCGYDNLIIDSNKTKSMYLEKNLKIGYIGVAYASSRNLMPAIESIIETKGIEMQIIGSYSKKYKIAIDELSHNKVSFMGRVSYSESLKQISYMDALFHIGNRGTMQVPGKTYIYLSSEKPIIYIRQQIKNDPTYEVLKEFQGIIFCDNNIQDISKALNKLINNFDYYKNESVARIRDKSIEKYSWKNISDDFAQFIESIGLEEKADNEK